MPKFMLYCGCCCWFEGTTPGAPLSMSLNLGKVGIRIGSHGSGASLKYEDWRHSSAVALLVGSYLEQFSVKTGVECIKNSKTMTQEEIEYCLPVMEMLGFKYKNETEED